MRSLGHGCLFDCRYCGGCGRLDGWAGFFLGGGFVRILVFDFPAERAEVFNLAVGSFGDEGREGLLIWSDESFEFTILVEIAEETGEVSVSGDDEGLVVPIIIDHGLEDELRIDIALDFARLDREDLLENDHETGSLEDEIEILVADDESEENIGNLHIVLIGEILTKSLPIDFPSEFMESRVEILSIDKGIVAFRSLLLWFHGDEEMDNIPHQ